MAIQRLLSQQATEADLTNELSLRPTSFKNYIGQEKLKANLKLAIEAAQKRDQTLDHVLLYGPAGLGKTSLAIIIAKEMELDLKFSSGPALLRPADLASQITNLNSGEALFIDEIHRLTKPIEEILYSVMEDFRLDIVLGKGIGARNLRLDLPRFTLIGATTKVGLLSTPLRDRFGHIHRLNFYDSSEIELILKRSARILGTKIDPNSAQILAQRSRFTPRIANRLLKRVRDYSDVKADGLITKKEVLGALKLLEIDQFGLDTNDRLLLKSIIEYHDGGPVGLKTLAAIMREDPKTIAEYYEPFLLQTGFLKRTSKGRCTTNKARNHLKNKRKLD